VFFFVGWGVWTLAEYLVHRFLLHWKSSVFWPEHLKHHQRPLADVGVPLHETVFISMYATAALWFCFGIDGALFATGASLGYVVYVSIHEAMHRATDVWHPLEPVLTRRTKLHDLHHKGQPVNYGITTMLWDRVFGTYKGA
jgi:sterol desaturase/sphingolipid hydroxylase (fatty acid hydroxylase superfamily)